MTGLTTPACTLPGLEIMAIHTLQEMDFSGYTQYTQESVESNSLLHCVGKHECRTHWQASKQQHSWCLRANQVAVCSDLTGTCHAGFRVHQPEQVPLLVKR